jgi:hypothetical protein
MVILEIDPPYPVTLVCVCVCVRGGMEVELNCVCDDEVEESAQRADIIWNRQINQRWW